MIVLGAYQCLSVCQIEDLPMPVAAEFLWESAHVLLFGVHAFPSLSSFPLRAGRLGRYLCIHDMSSSMSVCRIASSDATLSQLSILFHV